MLPACRFQPRLCYPVTTERNTVTKGMHMMSELTILIIVSLVCLISAAVPLTLLLRRRESPVRRAGRLGEEQAADLITAVLEPEDHLFRNVNACFEDMRCECDNVIVNRSGIFIIEVKNLSGRLFGTAEDYDWLQVKTGSGGAEYSRTVKNPIRQVRRQTYILSNYLKQGGCFAWVKGFAWLLQGNSPVDSSYQIRTPQELDRLIHAPGRVPLDAATITTACALLAQASAK